MINKRKEKRNRRIKEKTEAVIEAYRTTGTDTDPNGMYTGNTNEIQSACVGADHACVGGADHACVGGKIYINPQNSVPTQDADDL